MPELPDVTVYVDCLRARVAGEILEEVRLGNPFVLRSVTPPLGAVRGRRVRAIERMGKRIVIALDGNPLDGTSSDGTSFDGHLFLVMHLMVAGRLRWRPPRTVIPRRLGLAAFDFASGTLLLTEASGKKRASLHIVAGEAALRALDPGGIEPLTATMETLRGALTRADHTLKRALTDPHLMSGIGNAYSDEILHRARLSPVRRTSQLADGEWARLFEAVQTVLREWTERLRHEVGSGFPDRVTAFREGMAVHGRFRKPCPVCAAPVQRIVHGESEVNYCPTCQTGGRLLADRSLSRVLHADWPRTPEELEERRGGEPRRRGGPG